MLQLCFQNFVGKGNLPGPTISLKEVVAKGVAGYSYWESVNRSK